MDTTTARRLGQLHRGMERLEALAGEDNQLMAKRFAAAIDHPGLTLMLWQRESERLITRACRISPDTCSELIASLQGIAATIPQALATTDIWPMVARMEYVLGHSEAGAARVAE